MSTNLFPDTKSYGGGDRKNPDSRPLPPGWIEQYDSKYVIHQIVIQ